MENNNPVVQIVEEATFKLRPLPIEELSASEVFWKDPCRIYLDSYAFRLEAEPLNGHVKLTFCGPIAGSKVWYIDANNIRIFFDEHQVYPYLSRPALAGRSGPTISIPGVGEVGLYEPIIPHSNFLWSEATHGGERIPVSESETNRIVWLSEELMKARAQINQPFMVTSWYRPEPYNRQAGGATQSQHLGGGAIDFCVEGYTGKELAIQLDWWLGGMGIYSHIPHILHLDARHRWGGRDARWGGA